MEPSVQVIRLPLIQKLQQQILLLDARCSFHPVVQLAHFLLRSHPIEIFCQHGHLRDDIKESPSIHLHKKGCEFGGKEDLFVENSSLARDGFCLILQAQSAVTPVSSGGTPASGGGPTELRRQVAVRRNSGVRWRSGGTPASGGGPAELRRQVAVRRNSVIRWLSGETPASGGGPAELRRQVAVQRNSGGGRGGVSSFSSFSSSLLFFFSSCLGSPLMGNEGSIYSFFRVAWPVNKGKIRDLGTSQRERKRFREKKRGREVEPAMAVIRTKATTAVGVAGSSTTTVKVLVRAADDLEMWQTRATVAVKNQRVRNRQVARLGSDGLG
ncbi:hypothetical protein M5K25_014088 [Dendrobium thyrsiflorum]|uniref:Uncharacterized protein n=1 Tax=Dendrobium thyrsiflorum TaxID=117978 RepID=A0ABD0UVX2_DENTH